jgi:hypothetical protein
VNIILNGPFKVLSDGKSSYQGHPWSSPHDGEPGKWMPPIKGDLRLCERGYHYCRNAHDLLRHLGPDIYLLESIHIQKKLRLNVSQQVSYSHKYYSVHAGTMHTFHRTKLVL